MRVLNLSQTGIEILHSSIGHWSNLEELNLSGLRLQNLPNQLSCLRTLMILRLSNCEVIDYSKLHILFDGMLSLRQVFLDNCNNITELPNNIKNLLGLEFLILRNCKRLRSLPKLPPSIRYLDAHGCMSLETVSTSRPLNRDQIYISFTDCVKLNEQSLHNIIEDAYSVFIYELREIGAAHEYSCWICFPGSMVPDWFRYRTAQSSVIIELPQNSPLLGFAFCAVLQCHSEKVSVVAFECACYLGDFKVFDSPSHKFYPEMNSDHVYIWDADVHCSEILKVIERRGNHQSIKLSFEFNVEHHSRDKATDINELISIKEYGVCPIYVSDCQEFIRQMELERNKKRPRHVDEQQLLPQFKKLKFDLGTHTNTCLDIDELEALLIRMDIT